MTAGALLLVAAGVLLMWAGVTNANIADAISGVLNPK